MSKYANAHFKSTYYDRKVAPKSASCSAPRSKPTVDKTVAGLLPKSRRMRNHLMERSSHMGESHHRPLLFQKVCNETHFSELKTSTLVEESAVPSFKARYIPNQTFAGVGTARVTNKPKPLIQHVGSIENHPRFKVDVEMMNQKALRNLANLPDLLKKLQTIGATAVPVADSTVGQTATFQQHPPPPPPATPDTANRESKPVVSPNNAPTGKLKDDDDDVYQDTLETETEETPEKLKLQKTVTKARRQSDTLNSLLSELNQTNSERVSESIITTLREENIDIGRINRRVTLINFIQTRLAKLQKFIAESTGGGERKVADV